MSSLEKDPGGIDRVEDRSASLEDCGISSKASELISGELIETV
jgi:hypothetical protein